MLSFIFYPLIHFLLNIINLIFKIKNLLFQPKLFLLKLIIIIDNECSLSCFFFPLRFLIQLNMSNLLHFLHLLRKLIHDFECFCELLLQVFAHCNHHLALLNNEAAVLTYICREKLCSCVASDVSHLSRRLYFSVSNLYCRLN